MTTTSVRAWPLCGLLATAGSLAACSEPLPPPFQEPLHFTDSGGKWSAGEIAAGEDSLSLPYAKHARLGVSVDDLADPSTWRIRSDAPAIVSVTAGDPPEAGSHKLSVELDALAEGSAHLELVDPRGEVVHSAEVTVRAANGTRFYSHGAVRLAGLDPSSLSSSQLSAAKVLVGGTAVFGVGWTRDGERLYGGAKSELVAPATMDVKQNALLTLANEVVFVKPSVAGTQQLALSLDGVALGTLPVEAVEEAEIASLELGLEQRELDSDGTEVWVLARARDAAGNDIYGAYSSFTLDGLAQKEQSDAKPQTDGDLYRYTYAKSGPSKQLVAKHGTHTAAVMVQAKSGYVADTTYLGCSAAPGQRASSAAALTIMGLAGLLLRRRRAA